MAERRIKAILEAQDRASPTFRRVSGAVKALGIVAAAVGVQQIGRQLVQGLRQSIDAASQYESAAVRLNVALKNQGQLTPATSKAFRDFARDLTDVSLATETQILSAIAQAKAFGASDEAARKLTKTAVDLAAATGVDMDTAFRQINRTLGGYAGELGELFPELKTLTSEQLKAGAAADILNEKVAGAGDALADTAAGAVNNLNSDLERLRRTIGDKILPSFTGLINEALRPAVRTFEAFIDRVGSAKQALNDLINEFKNVEEARNRAENLVETAEKLRAELDRLADAGVAEAVLTDTFVEMQQAGKNATLAIDALIQEYKKLLLSGKSNEEGFRRSMRAVEELQRRLESFGIDFRNFTPISEEVAAAYETSLARMKAANAEFFESFQIADAQAAVAAFLAGVVEPISKASREVVADNAAILQESLDGMVAAAVENTGTVVSAVRASSQEIVAIGEAIETALGRVATRAAAQLADVLVQAAFEGKLAFSDFFKQLLKDLARAIIQALILRYILGGTGVGGFQQGGIVPPETLQFLRKGGIVEAQRGFLAGLVPGVNRGRDSTLIAAQPGEAVLPRQLTEFLLQAASRGLGGGAEVIELRMDEGIVARRLSDGVQRGSVRLVASRLRDARVTR